MKDQNQKLFTEVYNNYARLARPKAVRKTNSITLNKHHAVIHEPLHIESLTAHAYTFHLLVYRKYSLNTCLSIRSLVESSQRFIYSFFIMQKKIVFTKTDYKSRYPSVPNKDDLRTVEPTHDTSHSKQDHVIAYASWKSYFQSYIGYVLFLA